ncbi:MAG TPA: TetR family transcriptional regulator [Candidatus Methanoperedens sp.]
MLYQEERLSLREKKKAETKKKIFEVSGNLFKEKGFDNVTVDEITAEAGIAKGTFFNYFPTKLSLLRYFGEMKEKLAYDSVKEEMMRSIPAKEKIKNIMVFVAKSNEKDKELTKLLVFEYIKYTDSRTEAEGTSQGFSRILYHFLCEGVKKGEVKSDIDLEKAAENLAAVYFQSLIKWLRSEIDYSFSKDISERIDMIFGGIGS